jgi:single-strand DNA-binding protein
MANISLNDCTFIGTIGKNVDVKYANSGTAVANFSIACSKSVKKGDTWENKTDWVPVCCFGKTAEYVAKNAEKGTVVLVKGEYNTSTYEKDGKTVYKTQIIANMVKVVSGKAEHQQDTQEDLPADENSEALPF